MADTQLVQQPWPLVYVQNWITQAFIGTVLVLDAGKYQPSALLLTGIELTSLTLANGDQALINYLPGGPTGDIFTIHRGFVYTSSQGVFPWRGELLMQSGSQLTCDAAAGHWSIVCSARVIPSYAYFV